MTDLILAAFVVLIAFLVGAAALPARVAAAARHTCAVLAGSGCALALLALLDDQPPAALELPFGLPGQSVHLALDPLGAGLLLLLFVAGGAVAWYEAETTRKAPAVRASVPLCLAGLALAVLADDAYAMAIGLSLAGIVLWAGLAPGRPHPIILTALLLSAAGLSLAAMLLSPRFATEPFETIRTAPVDPARQTAGFLCALAAAGTLAGIAPLRDWPPSAGREAPAPAAALFCGALAPVALGLLLRVAIELAGTAPPLWWAPLTMALGAAATLLAGWRAVADREVDAATGAATRRQGGLAVMALGLALLGKGADLPALASLSVAAMLLILATQALCGSLAILAAASLQRAGGSRRIDRLGGLMHFMPATSTALLCGLFGLAALPLGAGFASFYLLLQAALSAPRAAGVAPSLVFAGTAVVLALGGAIGAAGMVRLVGVACLGRPRTPRAAAATEVSPSVRTVLLTLAGLSVALGLLPGLALQMLGAPAVEQLTGVQLGDRVGILHLGALANGTGYAPIPLAALLAMVAGTLFWRKRRRGIPIGNTVPIWQDGFAPSTGWMPFGDPLTQSTGMGFLPHPAMLDRPRWSKIRVPLPIRPAPRLLSLGHRPLALLVVFAVVLAMLACAGIA